MNSRSKCVARCLLEFNANCSNNTLFANSLYHTSQRWILFGQKVLNRYNNHRVSPEELVESGARCRRQCPSDCDQSHYSLSVSKVRKSTNKSVTELYITAPQKHLRILHIPAISFLSYLGTLGGLAGVWMGVSFYHICGFSVGVFGSYLRKMVRLVKRKSSKIKIDDINKITSQSNVKTKIRREIGAIRRWINCIH